MSNDTGRWAHFSQCSRKGVVTREGIEYCRQHDPHAVAARREHEQRGWELERQVRQAKREAEDAALAAADDLAGLTGDAALRGLPASLLNARTDLLRARQKVADAERAWVDHLQAKRTA